MSSVEHCMDMFERLDKNDDGGVVLSEMTKILRKNGYSDADIKVCDPNGGPMSGQHLILWPNIAPVFTLIPLSWCI